MNATRAINHDYVRQPSQSIDAELALNAIPADTPRNEWIRVATAFKAAGGDFEAFDAWSSTASNYKVKDCASVWKSITPHGGIGAGTLFFIAQQYGYKSTGTPPDLTQLKEQAIQRQQAEQQAKQLGYRQARDQAEIILNKCTYATANHAYLIAKQIRPRLMPWVNDKDWLVIPVMDLQSNVHSLQFISSKGEKLFLAGGAIKGHFYQLWSGKNPNNMIVICEGYATGVTLYSHYVSDCSVVVAYNVGNLSPVAKVFRAAYPDADIIIAGDNDKSGTGQATAREAALAVGGALSIPLFIQNEVGSDWNDRWNLTSKGPVA